MLNYIIIVIISVFMLARERTVRPNRMWILPAILILVIGAGIAQTFTMTSLNVVILIACTIIGIFVGIWRGKLERIRIHPTTRKITSQTPIEGVILFIFIILVRALIGYWGAEQHLVSLGNDMLMIPLVSVCVRRYYVYLKYKQFQSATNKLA